MTDISRRENFITQLIVEPKIKRLLYQLKQEMKNDEYFKLTTDERQLVAKQIMEKSINETARLFMSSKKYNEPKFIYQLSINNLNTLNQIFEELELYCYCQMLTDAVKLINDELQYLDREQL
jgi:hypothetical protein